MSTTCTGVADDTGNSRLRTARFCLTSDPQQLCHPHPHPHNHPQLSHSLLQQQHQQLPAHLQADTSHSCTNRKLQWQHGQRAAGEMEGPALRRLHCCLLLLEVLNWLYPSELKLTRTHSQSCLNLLNSTVQPRLPELQLSQAPRYSKQGQVS